MKETRLRVQHFIAGITEFWKDSKIPLTYDGLPKILGDLIPLIRTRDLTVLRYVLTLVN
jgi:hypothetical protein